MGNVIAKFIRCLLCLVASSAPLMALDEVAQARSPHDDSVRIDALIDESWTHMRTDPAYSLKLLGDLHELFHKTGLAYRRDVMLYYYGVVYKNLNNFTKSRDNFDAYYAYHEERRDTPRMALVLMTRSNLYSQESRWTESMEDADAAIRFYSFLKDTAGVIRATSKKGYILLELGRLEDAMTYHREALQMAVQIGDSAEISVAYSNIALGFERSLQLDSALEFYRRSLKINQKSRADYAAIYDYNNMSNVFIKKEEYRKALPLAIKGLRLGEEIGVPNLIAFSKWLLGRTYIALGNRSKGKAYLEELIGDTSSLGSLQDQNRAHEILYHTYKDEANIPKAFYHLERHKELSDSILNLDVVKQVSTLEAKYQTERSIQQLAVEQSQRALSEEKLSSARRQIWYLIVGLVLLVGFLYYLYRLNEKVRHQNQMISEALEEKEVLLGEIHHRVKNNLQVISSLLSLQSRAEDDPGVVSALKLGQNRVHSMALIHQNLYQESDLTGVKIGPYFEKLIQSLFYSYNVSGDRISLKTDIADLNLDVDTVIPLGLIVNELITNALKYAFPNDRRGSIIVKLHEGVDHLYLSVADNGIGMGPDHNSKILSSFGYRLIRAFKQQLNAELEIKSLHGTRVEMNIKQYRKMG